MKKTNTPDEYLKAPYSRVVIPDSDTGTFTSLISEFPGCIAQGDTPAEAYENLEAVAQSWIEAALDLGQSIPEPSANQSFSGKILTRLPKSLHRRASEFAETEGISLNQLIVAAIAETVGAKTIYKSMFNEWENQIAVFGRNLVTTNQVNRDMGMFYAALALDSTASTLGAGNMQPNYADFRLATSEKIAITSGDTHVTN